MFSFLLFLFVHTIISVMSTISWYQSKCQQTNNKRLCFTKKSIISHKYEIVTFCNRIFQNSPAVSFWLTTSGNTDSGLGEECSGLWQWELPGLSLCVGLPQKGAQRLLFAGLIPSIGSKSNDLFRVAHAIFSLYLNCLKTLSRCHNGFRGVIHQILDVNERTTLLHRHFDYSVANKWLFFWMIMDVLLSQAPIWRSEKGEMSLSLYCLSLIIEVCAHALTRYMRSLLYR